MVGHNFFQVPDGPVVGKVDDCFPQGHTLMVGGVICQIVRKGCKKVLLPWNELDSCMLHGSPTVSQE